MNTSKSLDDTLSDLIASVIVAATSETPIAPAMKAKKKAVAAIVEAVEGLIIGEDDVIPTIPADGHIQFADEYLKAYNQLRFQQRMAIKEWQ